jgi:hypothetical protein
MEVLRAVRGRFKITHEPPKPSVWQGPNRLTKRDLWDKASASNTGLCYAEGACVVFVDDCTIVNDEFLLWHYRMSSRGLAACGGYKYTLRGTSKVENGRLVAGKFEDPGDHRLTTRDVPGECPGGWMYGGNASCPLEAALRVNGFDEIMSGQGGLEDCEFGLRIARAVPLWFVPGALAYQLTETHETVGEFLSNMHQPNPDRPCSCEHNIADHPNYGACTFCSCAEYKSKADKQCKGYRYRDGNGVEHYMSDNHRPIYRLMSARAVRGEDGIHQVVHDVALAADAKRMTTLGNRFVLSELRERILAGEDFPVPTGPVVDWRDGERLENM